MPKHSGADSLLFNAVKGTLMTSGKLTAGTSISTGWYKIYAKASSNSALPDLEVGSVFQAPAKSEDEITLATGDKVYPLTLTQICKVDIELSAEMGTIDTTDSCDYPYNSSLPDGFSSLSGSIGTIFRFDEDTDAIVSVTEEFLKRFFNVVSDDGEGTYALTSKTDEDLLLFILLNKNATAAGKVQNWIVTPAILTSLSDNLAMKDAQKGDYNWSKGDGPACVYKRTVVSAS